MSQETAVKLSTGLVGLAVCCAVGAASAAKVHSHGVMKLGVAVDGSDVTIVVQMPLDSLVGFERAPRTDAERKDAAAALEKMRDGAALFRLDAAAQCALASAKVVAPALEQPGQSAASKEHADLDASYVFQCAQPSRLASLDVLLFDAFKRIDRIDVQAVLPQGQSKAVLRRSARVLRLTR